MNHATRRISIVMIPLLAVGCTTFNLAEQSGTLSIPKHRRAKDVRLLVSAFSFEPKDPDDARKLTEGDLDRWQGMLAAGIDQSNIVHSVAVARPGETPLSADYSIGGRITRFRFQKNWVPTFFPLHLGLTFFTFTAYTLFGGPTTATIVRFGVEFQLTDARTGRLMRSFAENYTSTRAVNVYSKGANNPYDNPNLVFSQVIDSAVTKIAAALP